LRNEKIYSLIIRWALFCAVLLYSSSYAGLRLIYAPYGEDRQLIQASLMFIFLWIALSAVYSGLKEVVSGEEVLLLKKLGFSTDEFLVFCVFKMRVHFVVIVPLYFAIFCSANPISPLGMILCFFNSICLFLVILLLSGLSLAASNKIVAVLKNLVPAVIILHVFSSV
jgi:hypothetical protein